MDRGALHEVNDQLDTIRPITKWARRVLDPAEIPKAVHEAFHQLKTGRPRPVEIEVPYVPQILDGGAPDTDYAGLAVIDCGGAAADPNIRTIDGRVQGETP